MTKKEPLLSIILPVYNAEKYVSEAITSILNQSFSDFELIICDDGSSDNSLEVINSFNDSRIITHHNKENLGKIATVNNALSIIRGKYLTVHDADDISIPDRFLKQIEFLEKNSNISMCGTSFLEMNEKGDFLNDHDMPNDIPQIKKTQSFPDQSNFHGPTLVLKTSILNEVGGFYRTHYRTGEDIEFCTRVCEKYDATNLKEILYKYRLVSTSLTKSIETYNYKNVAHREFGIYLQKQRRESGNDLYLSLNEDQLEKIFEQFMLEAKSKQLYYYQVGINRSIYFGYFKNAFLLNLKWVKANPFDYHAYKYLTTISYQYIKKIL